MDPDSPEAKQLLVNELSKPEYAAARPTWFDVLAQSIRDWFESLQIGAAKGPPVFGLGLLAVLVVVVIVIAFLIFGLPRLNRRSVVDGALFGEDDRRSAAGLRADARAAASHGDHTTAVLEMFRAIARGLAERTVVSTTPGTTARDFAIKAGAAFPEAASRLADAGEVFGGIRYLGRSATQEQFVAIADLDSEISATRPKLEAVPV